MEDFIFSGQLNWKVRGILGCD